MNSKIIWSSIAKADFASIIFYLSYRWNDDVANNFINLANRNIEFIEQNPEQFPYFNIELNVRKCVLTKHNTIFYRQKPDSIEIVRIYDTRQNPHKLKF